jgi:hypothetical protein
MSVSGVVDSVSRQVVSGWALGGSRPYGPLEIVARRGITVVAVGMTGLPRTDLSQEGREIAGFRLMLPSMVSESEIIDGNIVIEARLPDRTAVPLRVWKKLLTQPPVPAAVGTEPPTVPDVLRSLAPLLTSVDARRCLEYLILNWDRPAQQPRFDLATNEFAALQVPVGTRSPDQSAVIGRDGILFLDGGSNGVAEQYSKPASQRTVDQWLDIFRARKKFIERTLGARYVQIIIPEKLSVLPEHYPAELKTPTQLLSQIEEQIAADADLSDNYISGVAQFRHCPRREHLFYRTDSHLSSEGAEVLVAALCRVAGLSFSMPQMSSANVVKQGDLAWRFAGLPLSEVRNDPVVGEADAAICIGYSRPASGQHIGTSATWASPRAANAKTVLAFGNSFLEVGNTPSTLSWWLKHLAQSYEFRWSPAIERSLIESVRPDVVLCQTIERFLHQIPAE